MVRDCRTWEKIDFSMLEDKAETVDSRTILQKDSVGMAFRSHHSFGIDWDVSNR